MPTERLKAFTDGTIAIMVLELKPPHGDNWTALHASGRVDRFILW